jgi:hypothetical protein
MPRTVVLSVCALVALLGLACEPKPAAASGSTDSTSVDSAARMATAPAPVPPVSDSAALMALAKEVLQAATDRSYAAFAGHFHPSLGVRFSPYAFIDTKADKVFQAQAFQDLAAQAKKKIIWGRYDPRDEDIRSTVDGYFKEFVTDKPYLTEGTWAFNETIGSSTVHNNLTEIYPNAKFVEAHWVTKNEEMAPFEWGSVRLVFEQVGGKWYLVGVVHDAWGT